MNKRASWRVRGLAAIAASTTVATGLTAAPSAQADGLPVVINEIHYNGPSSASVVEFIELVNTSGEPVDVSGWSFTAGITLDTATMGEGTSIPAAGYLVGTNDPAAFQAQYGFAADFSFAGSALSNGGETVTLADSAGLEVDTVPYDDAAPWPVAPDGNGPSLELGDPAQDNAQGSSWHASAAQLGSPGAANSIPPLPLAEVTATPAAPTGGQPVTVSARSDAGADLSLTYKVMYGADVTVPMLDDEASPGGAGDGVYAATVPGAGEGELVRYRVAGARGPASASMPAAGDSRPYLGYVVADGELAAAQLPVLQWFMEDSVYNDMLANHRCDDVNASATFVWKGVVLDGAQMHIKGNSSCDNAKAKWDVELPAGYTFDFGAPYLYPLKKFDLQSQAIPVARIGWETVGEAGMPTLKYQNMRIQKNGSFFGIFGVLENYDGTWRKANGYGDQPFYKVVRGGLRTYASPAALAASGDLDKKNPEDGDYSDIWELTQWLTKPASPAKDAWIRANLDLPQIANATALMALQRQWDTVIYNYNIVKNPTTHRWQILIWDLDLIYNGGTDAMGDFIYPGQNGKMWKALYAMADFRQMHFRRLRTLHDTVHSGDRLLRRYDELTQPYLKDFLLEKAKWGGSTVSGTRSRLANGIQERRTKFAAHTNATEIPTSQSPNASVVINEVMYHPAGGPEYVELHNPGTSAVDMTGWSFGGFTGKSAVGAAHVIPAGGYMVWSNNDAALVAATGGNFVAGGQFSGSLSDTGQTLSVADGAREVDTVTYSSLEPWPTAADGTGPSLELTSPSADNALPQSWTATMAGGTPGGRNAFREPVTSTVRSWNAPWSYLATGPNQGSTWKEEAFDSSAWPVSAGTIGCRTTRAVTDIGCTTGRFTYYARSSVTIPAGPVVTAATLRIKRDDAVIVYVNGTEVARSNIKDGATTFTTRALTSSTSMSTEHVFTLPAHLLHVGTNVIAVEVHDHSARVDADLFLDANLQVTR